jgi:AAA15 family ATPase/GTPase
MIAGSVQKHKERLYQAKDMKLLKFSSIYGANAAGKSNLVKAMEYARNVIVQGTDKVSDTAYFKLDQTYQDIPSYFEFEICIDGLMYSYGFEMLLSEKKIAEEWLYLLGESRNEEIFYRNTTTGKYGFDSSLFHIEENLNRFDIYINDLKFVKDTFFLQDIVTNKEPLYNGNDKLVILKKVFNWISSLDISFPNSPVSGYSCFSSTSTEQIMEAVKTFATGISHVEARKVSREVALEDVPPTVKKNIDSLLAELTKGSKDSPSGARINCNGRLYLVHVEGTEPVFNEITFEHDNHRKVSFSLAEESDGTQRLLDMLTVLLCTQEPTVFVIDEIDRSLHPQLTVHFIKNFLSLAKKKNIQLIITTHESHLLDLSVLRQDEIWFAEKNSSGATLLTPFDRFRERFDKKIEKAYLDGRYGGVPLFDTFFFPEDNHQSEEGWDS